MENIIYVHLNKKFQSPFQYVAASIATLLFFFLGEGGWEGSQNGIQFVGFSY